MKYSTAHTLLNAAYLTRYNVNLAFTVIPSAIINPIVRSFKLGLITIDQTVEQLNTAIA